jgi:hypothetical protein
MELGALNHDERLALVALVEWVLKSDNRATEREFEELGRLVEAIGDDAYQALADEVATRFADDAALRAFLPAVTRQDARELIFTTLLDVAIADGVDVHESEMLAWLTDLWGIEIELEDEA